MQTARRSKSDAKRPLIDRRTPRPRLQLPDGPATHITCPHRVLKFGVGHLCRAFDAGQKWLGTVEATDVDGAIAEAVWRFDVKEPNKLIAVRRR